jgi:hypothetical protein
MGGGVARRPDRRIGFRLMLMMLALCWPKLAMLQSVKPAKIVLLVLGSLLPLCSVLFCSHHFLLFLVSPFIQLLLSQPVNLFQVPRESFAYAFLLGLVSTAASTESVRACISLVSWEWLRQIICFCRVDGLWVPAFSILLDVRFRSLVVERVAAAVVTVMIMAVAMFGMV